MSETMPDRLHRARVRLAAAATALAAAALLAACVPGSPQPAPEPEPSSSGTPAPESSSPPALDLEGDAAANRDYFDQVNQALIERGGDLGGRAFIDSLVEAGFPKEAMEVTADRTSVDLAADNIQFSVLLNDSCLVGQHGNVGYASVVSAPLSTGTCLIGQTRPIDW